MYSVSDQIAYLESEYQLIRKAHRSLETEFGEKGIAKLDISFARQTEILRAIITSLKAYQLHDKPNV